MLTYTLRLHYIHLPSLFLVQDDIEQLVLTERVETVIPLLYIITFMIAFHGPNAELIGNVKLTIWQYEAVTDINELLKNVFLFFAIDFSSAIVNGLILWTTCRINCFKILKQMQKEYWHILGLQEAALFVSVKMI